MLGLSDARDPRSRDLARTCSRDARSRIALIDLLTLGDIPSASKVADALLQEFGTLRRVVNASPRRLRKVAGESVTLVMSIYRNAACLALAPDAVRPLINQWADLVAYLRLDLGDLALEEVRVLFLDTACVLIRSETIAHGGIDSCTFDVRRIIARALELGASGLVMVHNHPSGDHTPSREDIDSTRRVCEAGRRLNVYVHDHIVVSSRGHTSLRALGLL